MVIEPPTVLLLMVVVSPAITIGAVNAVPPMLEVMIACLRAKCAAAVGRAVVGKVNSDQIENVTAAQGQCGTAIDDKTNTCHTIADGHIACQVKVEALKTVVVVR